MSIKYGAKVRLDINMVMAALGYNTQDADIVHIDHDSERGTIQVYFHGDVIQTRGRSTVTELQFTEIPQGCEWPESLIVYTDEDPLSQLSVAQCGRFKHSWEMTEGKGRDYTIIHKVCTTCGMESKKLKYNEEV